MIQVTNKIDKREHWFRTITQAEKYLLPYAKSHDVTQMIVAVHEFRLKKNIEKIYTAQMKQLLEFSINL